MHAAYITNSYLRSPPLQLAMRTGCDEMLSVALDGIILWDSKVWDGEWRGQVITRVSHSNAAQRVQKLQRKRSLGNGPYGAVHASYTPDGESLVAGFQASNGLREHL